SCIWRYGLFFRWIRFLLFFFISLRLGIATFFQTRQIDFTNNLHPRMMRFFCSPRRFNRFLVIAFLLRDFGMLLFIRYKRPGILNQNLLRIAFTLRFWHNRFIG